MNHIKKARLHRGMSQAELGEAVGLSASAIGMIEQGRRLPSLKTLAKLSDVLGCSREYLMELKDKEVITMSNGGLMLMQDVVEHSIPAAKISNTPLFKLLMMDDPELAKIVNATKVVGEHDVISHGKLISISPAKLELFHAALKVILEIGG
jgi:transcriptional regulator with XRE-family HTH domain